MIDDNYLRQRIDEASLPTDEEADFLLALQGEVDSGDISQQQADEQIDVLYGYIV